VTEEAAGIPPAPQAPPSAWTPVVGMALDHRTIKQRVYVLERYDIPAGVFWMVSENHGYGYSSDKPWLIGEKYMVEQYTPRPREEAK